jgi:hypothetical protein
MGMQWLISGRQTAPRVPRARSAGEQAGSLVPLALEPSPTALAAAARGRLASLASTDQTEPTVRPLVCPYGNGRVVIELYSGSVYPDRCRSSRCAYCLPLNARRRALAITYAAPQRMIRLSLVAGRSDESPCATALTRVGLIRRNLKRMGYAPGEWCFTIERNPKETGFHAHCLQRGMSIPQGELQEACQRARAGIPYINAIKRSGVWTSRYGLKGFGADGYGLKTFRPNGNPKEALRINHGRLEHHSRGFYAIEGTVHRVREMEREAIIAANGSKRVAFVGCLATQVDTVLADRQVRDSLIRDVHLRHARSLRAVR